MKKKVITVIVVIVIVALLTLAVIYAPAILQMLLNSHRIPQH
jgi:hypothetical protein